MVKTKDGEYVNKFFISTAYTFDGRYFCKQINGIRNYEVSEEVFNEIIQI